MKTSECFRGASGVRMPTCSPAVWLSRPSGLSCPPGRRWHLSFVWSWPPSSATHNDDDDDDDDGSLSPSLTLAYRRAITCALWVSCWLKVRRSSSCCLSATRASCFSHTSFSSIFMDSSISCFMPIWTSSSFSTSWEATTTTGRPCCSLALTSASFFLARVNHSI